MRKATLAPKPGPGFTFLEVLVVVAILGVIISIAYPAYVDFIERSRRSEAAEALQDILTRQEQFYSRNKFYASDLDDLNMPTTTANGYYQLSITAATTVAGTLQGYTLNANAKGSQTGDSGCTTLRLDWDGDKTPAQCW